MNNIDQFKKTVFEHACSLSPEQMSVYQSQSNTGECISMSYEVFRGYMERNSLEDFVAMAVSQNAIHPDAYLSDLLQDNHEVIGSLNNELQLQAADIPIFFFPGSGIYAAAVSENEVLDVWLSWPCYPVNW
ncbi:MAG: hypothetical protein E6733_10815 [Streptococcus parasanguinis]|nr:hypothetical protein [Streptococcus parasanguinis]